MRACACVEAPGAWGRGALAWCAVHVRASRLLAHGGVERMRGVLRMLCTSQAREGRSPAEPYSVLSATPCDDLNAAAIERDVRRTFSAFPTSPTSREGTLLGQGRWILCRRAIVSLRVPLAMIDRERSGAGNPCHGAHPSTVHAGQGHTPGLLPGHQHRHRPAPICGQWVIMTTLCARHPPRVYV